MFKAAVKLCLMFVPNMHNNSNTTLTSMCYMSLFDYVNSIDGDIVAIDMSLRQQVVH